MFPGFQQFPEGQIIAFALIFLRIVAFVVAWPIFGTQVVPAQLKVLLAIVLSIVIYPTVSFQNVDLIRISDQIVFLAFREVMIGLFLGYLLRFFFFALSVAGELIGISAGLASAQLFNPAMGAQSNVYEQVHVMLATLFILAMNGHHLFIQGLSQSYELVPIASIAIKHEGFTTVAYLVKDAFLMGFKMAAPVTVAIFLANLAMGIMGRAVPQLNVMMTSMQVTILVGTLVFFLSLPLYVEELTGVLTVVADKFFMTMRVL
ncbi:MAG: hypothetical protein BroJett040_14380 [Oligoflexia bacterium]|nr:MAG: hypothetical protein BroJett040_14380 [Oligoflexia bacterium]